MDNLHWILLSLLALSIIFLGVSNIYGTRTSPLLAEETRTEPEVWTTGITPDHLNNIADGEWLGRLKVIDNSYIKGSELVCLNICGNRCLWLGYSYKSHTVEPGTFPWGDKENNICTCSCYVNKMLN